MGNRIKIDESTFYPKSILADPEKYFTTEIMMALDEAAAQGFVYEYGKTELKDYIKFYDDLIDLDLCHRIINEFELAEA